MTTPTPNEQDRPKPTIIALQRMVDGGQADLAAIQIDRYKLPFQVVGLRVIHAGDSTEYWLARFITVHPAMEQMKNDIRKLANVSEPVLIHGETGTGKEIIARALNGDRGAKRFFAFNCAGVPETLIEAELFGHTKGAFTGAHEMRNGLLRDADGGTVFLDEIGEMPMLVQAKLLRTIQEMKVRKLGSNVEEQINCRFVCATNRDLRSMITQGAFRKDLYARLCMFEVFTLPLSKRLDDIPLIIESFDGGKEMMEKLRAAYVPKVETKEIIANLDVTFNVRSIQAMVTRYKILGKLPNL